ncbi:MAG: thiamine phosphate synthase [Syntrophales bacterium]|nr:thiamine phosphate synthase [Syntrophales bacterium]
MNRFKISGIYLVTDRGLCGGRPLEEVVLAAVKGGVRAVQLREKELSTRQFISEALKIKDIVSRFGVPLIINDRVDVALAVQAEGVHLGQEDMPWDLARKILGEKAIIGLSVETWDDVTKAEFAEVDYLGVSPVFPTPTKTDTKGVWGLDGLRRIRSVSRHQLVAIGGMNEGNAALAIEAGADAIAVVSAICGNPDPFGAAKRLCEVFTRAYRSNANE